MGKRQIIGVILLFLGSVLAGYAGVNFVVWKIDSERTNAAITELKKITLTERNGDWSAGLESDENWELAVNFSELLRQNNETVAWIEVAGTEVSYPVVQTTDNDFYLDHSFDKSRNSAGWVFLDYRNRSDFADFNTVVYAHGRLDNTMFGSLREVYKNKQSFAGTKIRIYTPRANFEYEVISMYLIQPTDDYIRTSFSDGEAKEKFVEMILARNETTTKGATGAEQILTLSTCYDAERRLVIHARKVI